ncbi:MAG: hypothetical protein GWN53_17055 [Gammaproteobacteria bacterium]|uniref:Uncharacterized protein n=1 Tax=Candidatus Kutchimonas denitrificans TaxID=3056748 RepID=A0AAE5CDX8_9BACT|nr:hypothetical protein [Candidatus Kutchimonas denitrificans]NIV53550.1 hypothetical protein [Gammaproteobacteria bacterium]
MSNLSLITRIKHSIHNDRFRNLSWWRRWMIRALDYLENRVWATWIYPHLRPRTWYKRRRDFWKGQAVPPRINAFLWGSEEGGYCVHLIEDNGPWAVCCGSGWTEEEAKESAHDILGIWQENAGLRYPEQGYTLIWKDRKPTNTDRAYTR